MLMNTITPNITVNDTANRMLYGTGSKWEQSTYLSWTPAHPDSVLGITGYASITRTSTQLELINNGSHKATFTVGATGDLTILPSGGDIKLGSTTFTAGSISDSGAYAITPTGSLNINFSGKSYVFTENTMTPSSAGTINLGNLATPWGDCYTNGDFYACQYSSDTDPPAVLFYKSRNTIGSPNKVENGDFLGRIDFAGTDTDDSINDYTVGARIQAKCIGNVSDGDLPTQLEFWCHTAGGSLAMAAHCKEGQFTLGHASPAYIGRSDDTDLIELTSAGEVGINGNLTIGEAGAGVDYTLTFDGESDDGVITYDEDNNLFNLADTGITTSGTLTASNIDQDVTSGSTPTFTGTNITGAASSVIASETSDTTCYPVFVSDATGTQALKTNLAKLSFNASTGVLVMATGSTVGNLTLADGSITDSGGAISFGNENLTTTGTLSAGASDFGDGGTTNYAAFASDGELTLSGTARVIKRKHLNVFTYNGASGSRNFYYGRLLDDTTDEYIQWHSFIMPEDYVEGTTVNFKVMWASVSGNSSGSTKYVQFYSRLNERAVGEAMNGAMTKTGDNCEVPDGEAAYTLHENTVASSSTAQKGDLIGLRTYRDADSTYGTDDLSGDIFVVYDAYMEYTADRLGEAT